MKKCSGFFRYGTFCPGHPSEKEGETYVPSQAARELSEKYDEVLLDEYQDSNLVQEILMQTVSGWVNERKNIFMVGDVKQSIYRFRLARRNCSWKNIRAIHWKTVRNSESTCTKISEADRKSLKVSTLFSGRSWGRSGRNCLRRGGSSVSRSFFSGRPGSGICKNRDPSCG